MFRIPGVPGKDLCDTHLGICRRDVLRVGGASMLGLTLNNIFRAQAATGAAGAGRAGWGKAKSVLMIYLQGGPSHLDLWDPKETCRTRCAPPSKPSRPRSRAMHFTEILPQAREA